MQDVSSATAELGRLRFGEMKVEDAMHEIVRSTHAIFDVDGAGLMLADADHHLRNVAVSDDRLAHLEELQIRHREGPCVEAFEDTPAFVIDRLRYCVGVAPPGRAWLETQS
jgi:hypothetical protein